MMEVTVEKDRSIQVLDVCTLHTVWAQYVGGPRVGLKYFPCIVWFGIVPGSMSLLINNVLSRCRLSYYWLTDCLMCSYVWEQKICYCQCFFHDEVGLPKETSDWVVVRNKYLICSRHSFVWYQYRSEGSLKQSSMLKL